MGSYYTRNKWFFGLGTIGRDMFYTLLSVYFLTFMTEVLDLSNEMVAVTGSVLAVLRIFDAFNDPLMGVIVDNTNSRWGKFKPAILIGALTSSVFLILLFTDLWSSSSLYLLFFILLYLLWDVTYGLNDIAYWSMLPALTLDQNQREKIGAFARIWANIGMYIVVVGIIPVTGMLEEAVGSAEQAWLIFAVAVSVLMIGFQLFTLLGVKENRQIFKKEEKTTLRGMFKAIFKNDQLLFTVIAMGLFSIGYTTTAEFGTYYFIYAYGDKDAYSTFTLILGVSQIISLLAFPYFSKRFTRRQLYTSSTVIVIAAYLLFFFTPMNMIPIGIAGVLLFVGDGFIQILMLMFLTDTIEYGQWKFGKRNEAVTFSVQPLINKLGSAIATLIITWTLIISGINDADTRGVAVTPEGITVLKTSMFLIPLICIIVGYFVYRFKYKIDKKFYDQIVTDLASRGDIKEVK
jgi:sugar (glycoside-pentoside-hexuronide) transporter